MDPLRLIWPASSSREFFSYGFAMTPIQHKITSHASSALLGVMTPPGDKSISHRSIMLGGIAEGTTTVSGLLEGEDVLSTIAALRAMGAVIHKDNTAVLACDGRRCRRITSAATCFEYGQQRHCSTSVDGTGIGLSFYHSLYR